MSSNLKPGKYSTRAGSIVEIGGKHGGVINIDFDWFEEDACCDSHPYVEGDYLHWSCDCCDAGGDGEGSALLRPFPREGETEKRNDI